MPNITEWFWEKKTERPHGSEDAKAYQGVKYISLFTLTQNKLLTFEPPPRRVPKGVK